MISIVNYIESKGMFELMPEIFRADYKAFTSSRIAHTRLDEHLSSQYLLNEFQNLAPETIRYFQDPTLRDDTIKYIDSLPFSLSTSLKDAEPIMRKFQYLAYMVKRIQFISTLLVDLLNSTPYVQSIVLDIVKTKFFYIAPVVEMATVDLLILVKMDKDISIRDIEDARKEDAMFSYLAGWRNQ